MDTNKLLIYNGKIRILLRFVTLCYGNCYMAMLNVTSVTPPLGGYTVTACEVLRMKCGKP